LGAPPLQARLQRVHLLQESLAQKRQHGLLMPLQFAQIEDTAGGEPCLWSMLRQLSVQALNALLDALQVGIGTLGAGRKVIAGLLLQPIQWLVRLYAVVKAWHDIP
jgi:hypothetical protein